MFFSFPLFTEISECVALQPVTYLMKFVCQFEILKISGDFNLSVSTTDCAMLNGN